jgi:hypothetical protein
MYITFLCGYVFEGYRCGCLRYRPIAANPSSEKRAVLARDLGPAAPILELV